MSIKYSLITTVCAMFTTITFAAEAAEVEVNQLNKTFSVDRLKIKVGDSIDFTNSDPYFHNVFALSDAKTFDLGSYPKGQSRKVTFNELGTVQVECAIHPTMKITVEVVK